MQVFISTRKTMQRKELYPDTPTLGNTYTILSIPPQAPSHSHLHNKQIKERKKEKRESRLPWSASTLCTTAPTSGLAPLVHVRLVHVHLSYTCTSRDSPGTPHTLVLSRALFHTARPLRALFHTASISTSAFPHSLDLYKRFSTQRPFARLLRTASRPLLSFATP